MKHTTAALLIAFLLLSACHKRSASEARASGGSTVAAPPACTVSNGVGRLKLLLTTAQTLSETAEALVRLQGVTERSTVRVNATLGTTFELRPGSYRLLISLPGYNRTERSVSVECGDDDSLTVSLARKR